MNTVKQEKIQQHYDTIADVYDNHYDRRKGRCYHTHISNNVIKTLPKTGTLLDLGCGTGLFVEKYLMYGGNAVGIDLSRKMIERAHRRCSSCNFAVSTAEKLPFADESFDAVSSLLVFTYLKDPSAMLDEAYRVLKPGGSIAICTLGKKFITKGIPALYHISEKIHFRHVVMKNFGERYYDETEMYDLFSSAGFTGIEVNWCSFAHINMFDPIFRLAQTVEPFVESHVPQLAYNICVYGKKPGK
jgi:ubiquinone/menaquinone biosynthesis C-methylase UbiE